MPRSSTRLPRYRKHKASGQAIVTFCGHDFYLGPHGTQASQIEYDRLIAEWLAGGRQPLETVADGLTVIEAIALYWRHVKAYYVKHGRPTHEQAGIRSALRFVASLYGETASAEFSPLALKAVRNVMVEAGLARSTINQNVSRIRRMFKWLAAEQLVPVGVYQSLAVVDGLRRGRSAARETAPVAPVADAIVDATLPHLPAVVADMVRFQRYTGCRPAEVCLLKPRDLDRRGEVWVYVPESHKTEHHGQQRTIFVGPKAQQLLLRYLVRDSQAYCFVPADSEAKRRAGRHAARRVPLSCGTKPGDRRKRRPKRTAGQRYDTASYRRSIARACDRAFPPKGELARRMGETQKKWLSRLTESQHAELAKWQAAHRWAPNQLRHTAGTEIRARYGIEAARVCLGHSKISTTEIYSERDLALASRVAEEVG